MSTALVERLLRPVVGCLALAALAAAAAPAELVILEGGRVLKASSYRVEGGRAVIELSSGGLLEMPILRVDRVVDDEISDEPPPPPPAGFEPGFHESDTVPETPYGKLIFEAAKRHRVSPRLVAAMVRAESAFDPSAVSHKGAVGLLQLMPATARRFGLTSSERYRPAKNLEAGVRYLRWLLDRYEGELPLALAGYNAGETNVERYGGVPPFRETREYIRRIYDFLGLAGAGAALTAAAGR
ncbi:MAG: lytic transglycosylase domain-containing protein [Thermoanaerobaculia bacterium]